MSPRLMCQSAKGSFQDSTAFKVKSQGLALCLTEEGRTENGVVGSHVSVLSWSYAGSHWWST